MPTTSGFAHALGASVLQWRPEPGRPKQAIRWVAPIGVGLILASVIFGPQHGPLGLICAMAANAGRNDPMRRRVLLLVTVGAATFGAEALGLAIAPYAWVLPPLVTLLTFAVVWVWHSLFVGPPGPTNTVFAVAIGSFIGTQGEAASHMLPVAAVAWAGAAVTSVLILAVDRAGPTRQAVDAAAQAVTEYEQREDGLPEQTVNRLRAQATFSIYEAWRTIRDAVLSAHLAPTLQRSNVARLRGIQDRLVQILRRESSPALVLMDPRASRTLPLGRPGPVYLLGSAWNKGSLPSVIAVRAGLAVMLASATMLVSPVGHPYWAILSALIVLHMGSSRTNLSLRAAHRVLGTAVGVVLYFGLVFLHPGDWVKVAIMILAVYGLNCFVTRNYAISVVFVTMFALLMTPVTTEAEVIVLIRDRMVETVIGVSAAVFVIFAIGRRATILLIRTQYRRTLKALVCLLNDLTQAGTPRAVIAQHRRNVIFELEQASEILQAQREGPYRSIARWLEVQDRVTLLGLDVVAASRRDTDDADPAAAVARRELVAFIDTLPSLSGTPVDPQKIAERLREIADHYHQELAQDRKGPHYGQNHGPSRA